MTRWDVIIGGGVFAVLAVLTTQLVRSVREVLAVEKERRRRLPLVVKVAGEVERRDDAPRDSTGRSLPGVVRGGDGALPTVTASRIAFGGSQEEDDLTAFLDDEIAATARRTIRDQGLIP